MQSFDIATQIQCCNQVLSGFAKANIERRTNGIFVSWDSNKGLVSRRWQCRGGQDFYPVWSRIFPGGGTSTTALSQLVRWIQNKPVLPISTWRYWAGEKVKLLSQRFVDDLQNGGYPIHVKCVLCGNIIEGNLDWWHLGKVSGPCCGWTSGCRQKVINH
jgi:hypothetical protein